MHASAAMPLPANPRPRRRRRLRPRPPTCQRGFTLIELIIAAGLIALLAKTATFFWVDNLNLVRTVNTDSAAIADGRALLERLAREVREVKIDAGVYCVSTMTASLMVFNKTSGATSAAGCGGATPTGANNDIAVTIQLPNASTNLNLGYAGTLAAPATTQAMTTYASSFGLVYLQADATTVATNSSNLRYVQLSLTQQPTGVQATTTRTLVALRNN